jgi:hypothetical protein
MTAAILGMMIGCIFSAAASTSFDTYFNGKRLRVDFVLSGNAGVQTAAPVALREEPVWGGPRENLIDPFGYGGYLLEMYDRASGRLIYSRGFNTLFEEWRTTAQARNETQAWINSIVMPYPRQTATALCLARNRSTGGAPDTLMTLTIDPASIFIDRSPLNDRSVRCLQHKGAPSEKVDLAFLAEGYTAAEEEKFRADAARFMESLFSVAPFDRCREDFNVYAVFLESCDSGTDFPSKGVFKNTALHTAFDTFGTDRYLTTPDMKSLRDAVWDVPCDAIFVLVNSAVYGGGGMYNFYAIGTADHEQTLQVFVHEFGHSFAGLADEYFSSETSYEDFYNIRLEPWEPNITTLVDFDTKWKDLLPPDRTPGTPVPVPVPPVPPVPTPTDTSSPPAVVGLYEGGGYCSKGIYRPADHCMMRDLTPFCPVCSRAILRMVDFWSDREVR